MVEIESLSKQLGLALLNKRWTVTTAESCTGGGISQAITAIAGSSRYFDCAFVTYSNDAKQKLVNVQKSTLEKYGAVSQETVDEMALGALTNAGAQVGISVSGIAGPDGGTENKPVGTVWIAVCVQYLLDGNVKTIINSQQFCFSGGRDDVRSSAVKTALNMTLTCINEIKLKI